MYKQVRQLSSSPDQQKSPGFWQDFFYAIHCFWSWVAAVLIFCDSSVRNWSWIKLLPLVFYYISRRYSSADEKASGTMSLYSLARIAENPFVSGALLRINYGEFERDLCQLRACTIYHFCQNRGRQNCMGYIHPQNEHGMVFLGMAHFIGDVKRSVFGRSIILSGS